MSVTLFCSICGDVIKWEVSPDHKGLQSTPCDDCCGLLDSIRESAVTEISRDSNVTVAVKKNAKRDKKATEYLLRVRKTNVLRALDMAKQVN